MRSQKGSGLIWLIVLLVACLTLSGCGVIFPGGQSSDNQIDEGDQFGVQEQELTSEEDGQELTEEENTSDGMNPEEDIVAIACPAVPTDGFLIVYHQWDWSLNRKTEDSQVTGEIDGGSVTCPLTIINSRIYMDQCAIPITNKGFINTSNGVRCDVNAEGTALISVEDGLCKDGVVYLTILEVPDIEHSLDGEKVCPGFTEKWSATFPISVTDVRFQIQSPGDYQAESFDPDPINQPELYQTDIMDPDPTGHFYYYKTWRLEMAYLMRDEINAGD